MKTANASPARSILSSPGAKALIVAVLVLFFFIPLQLVDGIVGARVQTRDKAEDSIIEPTGGNLELMGPYIALPYERSEGYQTVRGEVLVFARKLSIESSFATETRKRGLFTAPVFAADLAIEGEIQVAGVQGAAPSGSRILWAEARIVLELGDVRSLRESPELAWNGAQAALTSLAKGGSAYPRAIASKVAVSEGSRHIFSARLPLRGGRSIRFLEPAGEVRASVLGDWPGPSFKGYVSPTERELSDSGFSAQWFIPESSQALPAAFDAGDLKRRDLSQMAFGVDLLDGVDGYDAAKRAVDYGILFIVAPFAALFLFEILTRSRVHPVQYALIGLANCLFYLLLLSLSEIVGFGWAYALAAFACSLLAGAYSAASLRSKLGYLMIPGLGLLYGYLYTALRSEDYALLIGSLGLFALLAGAMYATRKIDWYGARAKGSASHNAPPGPSGGGPGGAAAAGGAGGPDGKDDSDWAVL